MKPHRLEKLFSPLSIAVLGASEDLNSVGGRVFHNLIAAGFAGTVVPVNPRHDQVAGRKCFATVADLDDPPDLAIIATPADAVVEIVRQCGERGIGAALILSAGFGESGDRGVSLEAELVEAARRADVRFIGPNCLGVMRPGAGYNATFLGAVAPAGRLALVSQSGALCAAITDWARPHHLGFSTIVSLGNASDVDFGDVLDYLAVDPRSEAILLYIEGISDARAFMSGLRIAARIKPVIVLRAGRHVRGSQAARTHTGAMVGSDEVFDAALERAGVVRAMTFGQLFAAAEILSAGRRAGGNRLAIVTNGGGAGVLATDRAEELGVALADLEPETVSTLDAALPSHWSHGNPVDILGDAGAATYEQAVKTCLNDRGVDGVLVMLTPQAMTDPEGAARAVVNAAATQPSKPVLACFMGETSVVAARVHLSENGVPDFTTPERAVEAFSYLARHRTNQQLLLQTPGRLAPDRKEPDVVGARMIVEAALAEGRSLLSDVESKAVVSAFRIPCNQAIEASTAGEALVAAETLGFPVSMKILSPQISHKTDVGGVRTGITSGPDVRLAFGRLTEAVRAARPDAEIRGVTIERMVSGPDIRELMVGVKRDPVFGPAITFGAGGTLAEILRDNAVALPPLNKILAGHLIARTRVARLLGPFRNMAAVDRVAMEDLLLRLSDLACELPHVEELDINPLFAGAAGVVAGDARIVIRRPDATAAPYAHMAIHPYPVQFATRAVLPGGVELIVRPIRPEDAEIEQAFVRRLSPQARYFRFMHSVDELTPEMLMRFTQIDYGREMALIAVVMDGEEEKQIGVARYLINPDGESCEFAIVVSDEMRHQGIGSLLMVSLIRAARDHHHLKVVEGAVLADNADMLELMRSLGFTIRPAPAEPELRHVEHWL